ncbi:MAG TPA: hypothetical protein ENG00_01355 [Candidatus Aenigmarchaeota archaeon]|nr:hypothetical protein [Candidatus Aenigmarchaeota archaeon]
MLLFWALFFTGLVGFGLGSYWDIKTTEFPDWLPYSMILLSLILRGTFSYLTGDVWIVLNSIIFGVLFLGLGLGMYFAKQWGDGDAWLLGAMGFLFPDTADLSPPGITVIPFPMVVLFNFFLIAFVYIIIYSLVLGIRNPKKSRRFLRELRGDLRNLGLIVGFFAGLSFALVCYLHFWFGAAIQDLVYLIVFPGLLLCLLVFMRYGRFVEANLFRKRIPVSRLRVGDVLISDRWRGLTEAEVKKLKRRGGYVWIKEGVRFAPVFIITMVISLFYGSLMVLFV